MTNRQKSTAGVWITVALVAVLVGYPLSFGPAIWLTARGKLDKPVVERYDEMQFLHFVERG